MGLKRNMIVARRDGGLLIHGAITTDEAVLGAIEAPGPFRLLLVPNAFHRLDRRHSRRAIPDDACTV